MLGRLLGVCNRTEKKSTPNGVLFLEKEKEKVEKRVVACVTRPTRERTPRLRAKPANAGRKLLRRTRTIAIVDRNARSVERKLRLCKAGHKSREFHHYASFLCFFYCPYHTPMDMKMQRLTCTKYIKTRTKFYAHFTKALHTQRFCKTGGDFLTDSLQQPVLRRGEENDMERDQITSLLHTRFAKRLRDPFYKAIQEYRLVAQGIGSPSAFPAARFGLAGTAAARLPAVQRDRL